MSQRDKPRQIPLALTLEPGRAREDLVVSAANAAAVEMIDRWPDWPASTLVLAGPSGSGKSHLGTVWAERAGAFALRPDVITTELKSLEAGKAAFIDDADVAELDETGLFHAINYVSSTGGSLLLSARRFPAAWGVKLPDLASRLRAAPTVEIGEPDDALLAGVITKLFTDRQVSVEPHVVQFMVRRMERSLEAANETVDQLDRLALQEKSRITRAMAASVVGALDHGQGAFEF